MKLNRKKPLKLQLLTALKKLYIEHPKLFFRQHIVYTRQFYQVFRKSVPAMKPIDDMIKYLHVRRLSVEVKYILVNSVPTVVKIYGSCYENPSIKFDTVSICQMLGVSVKG